MQNMINGSFENLAQRGIYYFLSTYPSLYPVKNDDIGIDEQKAAYEFIKGIYEKLYENPALLGLKCTVDDSFGDWEPQKAKPYLAPAIRGIIKRIEELIEVIWKITIIGQAEGHKLTINKADIQLKPSFIKQLAGFGLDLIKKEEEYILVLPFPVKGLRLLAEISAQNMQQGKDGRQKPYLLFSRGVYDTAAPWSKEVFGKMFEEQRLFDRLIDFLEQNGYQRIDNKEYGNQISLDYIKNYGKPDDELKWAWGERTHGGIEVIYEDIKQNQPLLSMRIPYFADILKNSAKMNLQVKNFVTSCSKKCDGCRYCVQTDKTGKRPLAYITIDEYKLCPLYAGFQYRWKSLKEETVYGIIHMLQFIDDIFADRKC